MGKSTNQVVAIKEIFHLSHSSGFQDVQNRRDVKDFSFNAYRTLNFLKQNVFVTS